MLALQARLAQLGIAEHALRVEQRRIAIHPALIAIGGQDDRASRGGNLAHRGADFDLQLLQDYWLNRKYHHTMSSTLVYALHEALAIVEEEGLEARWARHQRNHQLFVDGLRDLALGVLPPEGERLWTLNAVRVPDGEDEAAVRKRLLEEFGIEIGAGLGPLAGKIWRVGLMGASSAPRLIVLLLGAMRVALGRAQVGHGAVW